MIRETGDGHKKIRAVSYRDEIAGLVNLCHLQVLDGDHTQARQDISLYTDVAQW